MNLSDIFTQVAHKKLVQVDLPNLGSHQHELNGVAALREFFGITEATKGIISWHYFADDLEPVREESDFTFYDARARSSHKTGRSEWRFYYQGNFLAVARSEDLFVLTKATTGRIYALVFAAKSAWERAAQNFFGFSSTGSNLQNISQNQMNLHELKLLQRQILEELELDLTLPVASWDEDIVCQKFQKSFPTTQEMSDFARTQIEVDFNDPDETLIRWLNREEELFRALEGLMIKERLQQGFSTVDEFIQVSLSVQNRRKSRMGHALQNHLKKLFENHKLRFKAQAKTESNNRPDFIFPGEAEYHDEKFNASLLVMLGVKSTCKDRWRQILTEADRITNKHLCTLESGISQKQTDEMKRQKLTLVIPAQLHETYIQSQLEEMMSVAEFIRLIRKNNRLDAD